MKAFLIWVKAFGRFSVALAIAVSVSSPAVQPATAGVPSDKLILGYTTVGAILTPVWIPAEMGIFQKYGLDVDMKYITTGPVVVSSLIAGEMGVAAASGEPIVSGILGGADLTIMGFGTTTTPVSLYVVPSITKVEQLKGASVAVSRLTSSGAYILKVGLKRVGLEAIKDVTLIQAGGVPESLGVLQAGKVQGAMLSPPTTYKAEALGFKKIWSGLALNIHPWFMRSGSLS